MDVPGELNRGHPARLLLPEEIPAYRETFLFDTQRVQLLGSSKRRGLVIDRVCRGCGKTWVANCSTIRGALKRGEKQTGLCHACTLLPGANQKGRSRESRPLVPEEIPRYQETFLFDTQRLEVFYGKRQLVIDRECRNCGKKFLSSCSQIRADIKRRGHRPFGLCRKCSNMTGVHQEDRRRTRDTFINTQGYVMQWVGYERAGNQKGYMLQHRLVMAGLIGRELKRNEQVHHKDANRQNNDPGNLELRIGGHGAGATAPHCSTCTCWKGIPQTEPQDWTPPGLPDGR